MSNLPPVGARAVVENMPRFQAAMDAVNRALDKSGDKAEQAAKRSSTLDKAYDRMAQAASRVSGRMSGAMGMITSAVTGMATKVVAAIGLVASALAVTLAAAIGVAIAGVSAFIGAFAAISKRGANYEGIIDSFERLTASVQISSNALLDDLRGAARGTIPDMELLRLTNLALAGATGETGKVFGEALPRLLEIARAQARATGQDVNYLYESLITGIKRGSPLLIDNTGLMLKVGEANAAYAEELGKSVEQLTAQEQQIALLNATLEAGQVALETYGNASETLAVKLSRARTAITNALDYLALAAQPVAKAVMDAINPLLTAIANFVRQAIPYLQALGQLFIQAIQPFLDQIKGVADQLNSPGAARAFFNGAANTFGAFLGGVVSVGAKIIQAVADIANAIADFLIGQSPPPKGPLSNIDQGGANVMLAWLQGFAGVSLEPVKQVARQVVDALGPIATMTLEQVEARLAQLDAAIKPFQDRLSIVRAEFDAITKIGDIAMGRIERQMTKAVQALIRGEAGSGATVRALDAQRQAIEDALEAQRQNTEEYELQLAIAEAMQARERALLNIRKAQLPTLEAAVETVKKADKKKTSEPKGKEEKEKTGSGELPELPGASFESAPLEDLFDLGTDPKKIANIAEDLKRELEAGFGDAGDLWAGATASLKQGGDRLAKGLTNLPTRIGESLQSAFEPIARTVQKHLLAAEEHIRLFTETTVPNFFTNLPTKISTALIALGNQLQISLVDPIKAKIDTYIAPLFADAATPGSIAYFFAQIPVQIETVLAGLGELVYTGLVEPIQTKVAEVQVAFDTFFNGEGEGSLNWIINQALIFLSTVPERIGQALQPVATFIMTSFVNPIIGGLNAVIAGFEGLLNNLRELVIAFGTEMATFMRGVGSLGGPFAVYGIGGELLQNTIDALRNLPPIRIGRLEPAILPDGAGVAGAAKGGVFGPGALRVHRGEELIASSARQLTVFPARVVRALEAVASVAPAAANYVHPSVVNNSTTFDNSRHYDYGDFIVNGAPASDSWRREWAMAKTFR